jgi:cbb3-type cytochrome oxidase subunit 3
MKDLLPLIEAPLPVILLTPVFLAFFIGVIVWVYRSGGKKHYEQIGDLPLEDGTTNEEK